MKVTLSKTQWEMVTEALLDSQDKLLVYLAKKIQLQVYNPLDEWKENLRRNGYKT